MADLVPFCGGSCGRCSLMQGGTGQGKPDRSEYRVRPGLKILLKLLMGVSLSAHLLPHKLYKRFK